MNKIQTLTKFPVNHLSQLDVPRFVDLLNQISALVYYVINFFISFSSEPTLAILLCIIDFSFHIIDRYGVVLNSN